MWKISTSSSNYYHSQHHVLSSRQINLLAHSMSSVTYRTMRPAIQTSHLLRRGPTSATRAFSLSSIVATPPYVAPAPAPKSMTTRSTPAVASKNTFPKPQRSVVSSATGSARPASTSASPIPSRTADLANGLDDEPPLDLGPPLASGIEPVDWTRSYHGLSDAPFSNEAAEVLMAPLPMDDVEVKPDGIIYLPEIKYRRILNRAFGPGGWGLAPRGETIVTDKMVTREYALVVHGRSVQFAHQYNHLSRDRLPSSRRRHIR